MSPKLIDCGDIDLTSQYRHLKHKEKILHWHCMGNVIHKNYF